MGDAAPAVEDFLRDSALFGVLPDALRSALAEHLVSVSIQGGETLIAEGDEADGLFLVVLGRLQARVAEGDGWRPVGDIGRGEVVGEAALLTEQRRTASVVALRDSELLHLPTAAFEQLVTEHPSFLRPVAAQVVGRMLAERAGTGPTRPVTTVAVVPAHTTSAAVTTADAIAQALCAVVPGANLADPADRPTTLTEAEWAHAVETDHALVVYRADSELTDWTRRCLRQADAVVVVADTEQPVAPSDTERLVADHRERVGITVELVLVHPRTTEEPRGTARWLNPRSVRRHHHVRAGDAAHVRRVARLVTNQGIGLVLSGGGARAMAEIGVVDVMARLGMPIDAVGGTSAGALVAGAVARGWPPERVRQSIRRGMVEGPNPVDLTVPVASLASGRRMTERLREAAGDLAIEDLWLDYFCVSTNLSRNGPAHPPAGPGVAGRTGQHVDPRDLPAGVRRRRRPRRRRSGRQPAGGRNACRPRRHHGGGGGRGRTPRAAPRATCPIPPCSTGGASSSTACTPAAGRPTSPASSPSSPASPSWAGGAHRRTATAATFSSGPTSKRSPSSTSPTSTPWSTPAAVRRRPCSRRGGRITVNPDRTLALLARILRALTAPFVRYDIRGGRCATEVKVAVIAVNHRSMFDVVAGLICLHHFGHYPRLLIERRYVEGKWTAPFARAIGAIPVDRDGSGGVAFAAALDAMADGIPIIVMPEGRLHWDPDDPRSTGPTRTGVSKLAVAASMPIVAAALTGTEKVMPATARFPHLNPFRRKTVVCNVADDLLWLTSDDHRANTDEVMATIRSLMV